MSLLCLVYGCVIEHRFRCVPAKWIGRGGGLKGFWEGQGRKILFVCASVHVLNENFSGITAAFADGPQ